jgi:hypothetical protein
VTTLLTDKFFRSKEKHIQKPSVPLDIGIYGSLDYSRGFKLSTKKFYMPNNAVLVVAGDFKTEEAKQWIQKYFGNQKDQL